MRNRDAGYVKWPFNDGMCPEYEERKELLRVSEIFVKHCICLLTNSYTLNDLPHLKHWVLSPFKGPTSPVRPINVTFLSIKRRACGVCVTELINLC